MKPLLETDQLRSAVRFSHEWLMRLLGISPMNGCKPLTQTEQARIWQDHPSFTQFLPFKEYDPNSGVFLFEDGCSVGAVFELQAVDVEGRSVAVLKKIEKGIRKALQGIPGHHDSPWILQFYLQDDPLAGLMDSPARIRHPRGQGDRALSDLDAGTGGAHRAAPGQAGRAVLRRRLTDRLERPAPQGAPGALSAQPALGVAEQNRQADTGPGTPLPKNSTRSPTVLSDSWSRSVSGSRRYTGRDLYRWLLPWFSPRPDGFKDAWEYLRQRHFATDEGCLGDACDLGEMVTLGYPESRKDGCWEFTGAPHRLISLQAIDTPPITGVLTAEQDTAHGKTASLWDRLPKGSIFVTTLVAQAQSQIKTHCDNIIEAAGQGSSEATQSSAQAHAAKDSIAAGRYLYPAFSGLVCARSRRGGTGAQHPTGAERVDQLPVQSGAAAFRSDRHGQLPALPAHGLFLRT